jgi:hypothetical protein
MVPRCGASDDLLAFKAMQPTALDRSSYSHTIKVSELPFPVTLADMAQPVGAVVADLALELRKVARGEERVRAGRIFATRDSADGSVSLDAGWRAGCTVSVRRKAKAPDELILSVHPISRLTRWLQWGSFALLLALSPPVGKCLLPVKWDKGTFLALLLFGSLAGVAAIVLIGRARLGSDRKASDEVAARVRDALASWVERFEERRTLPRAVTTSS